MFDNCVMMINIYNKLFNSLFTNKVLAQDTSHSACANKKKSTRVHILNRSPFTCKLKPARGGCSGLVWDINHCRDPDGAILIPPCGTPDASTETQVEGEGVSLCTSIPWELQDATHWSSSVLRAQWQPQHWMGSWAVKTATSLPLFLGPWRFRWGINGITEEK